ncbi:Cell differentiation protein rcd1 [Tieghemostelium lacteum]|uniref:Cell differentiation protein rcd1 n=1 Tax=Tieghemostelium lacteum TaxID=361077 RepID=A0A151ZKD7_TIELA|nr:Cell differentiation protein rcd1 [Tieghemostelium lacteum]|eukprot:KYQ94379.1 Cell differentiation protein rcd1 [Tieghemostelium lacteum]
MNVIEEVQDIQDPLNNIDPINNNNENNNIINNIENINNNNQNNNIINNIENNNNIIQKYFNYIKYNTKQILFVIIMISISIVLFRIGYSRYIDKSIVILEQSSNRTVSYEKQPNSIVFNNSNFTDLPLLYFNHQFQNLYDNVLASNTYEIKCKELSNISSSLNKLNYKYNGIAPFLTSIGRIKENCEDHSVLYKKLVKQFNALYNLINAGIKNLIMTNMNEDRIHHIGKQLVDSHNQIQDLKVKVVLNYNEFKNISRVLSVEISQHEKGTDALEWKNNIDSMASIIYENQTSYCISTAMRLGEANTLFLDNSIYMLEIDKKQENLTLNINHQKLQYEEAVTFEQKNRWLKSLYKYISNAPNETAEEIKTVKNILEDQTINYELLKEKVMVLISHTYAIIEQLKIHMSECEPEGKIYIEMENYKALIKSNSIPNITTGDEVLKQKTMTMREYSILKTNLVDIAQHLSILDTNNPTENLIDLYNDHLGTSLNTLNAYSFTTYFQFIFGMYTEIIAKTLTDLKQEMNWLLFVINKSKNININ